MWTKNAYTTEKMFLNVQYVSHSAGLHISDVVAINELLRQRSPLIHIASFTCFSCSTASNSQTVYFAANKPVYLLTYLLTLAAAGLPTLHNLPGSSLFASHIAGSIKVTFRSTDS